MRVDALTCGVFYLYQVSLPPSDRLHQPVSHSLHKERTWAHKGKEKAAASAGVHLSLPIIIILIRMGRIYEHIQTLLARS